MGRLDQVGTKIEQISQNEGIWDLSLNFGKPQKTRIFCQLSISSKCGVCYQDFSDIHLLNYSKLSSFIFCSLIFYLHSLVIKNCHSFSDRNYPIQSLIYKSGLHVIHLCIMVIGLSFERLYLIRGLNLMIPKSVKNQIFKQKLRILSKNCRFWSKTTDFDQKLQIFTKNCRFW